MKNAAISQATTRSTASIGVLQCQDPELQAARKRLFNPASREFLRDPYATYKVLRERQPLGYRPRTNAWVATRYRDIQVALRDPRFGRRPEPFFNAIYGEDINHEPVIRNNNLMMMMRNDPDHARLRDLVNGSFNARRVLALKASIAQIAHGLIDRMPASGQVDLMRDFAQPLPVIVICELLGIPESERQRFIDERVVSERIFQSIPMTPGELAQENQRFFQLRDFFLALCAEKRQAPCEDLVSDLVKAHDRGALSEDELVAMIWLIFGAGHDTTVNLIGNSMVALHRHPEQLLLVKTRPELTPDAVRELLRFDSSVQMTDRHAFETVELGGQRIEAGQTVLCVLGAANRDPEIYPDPDRLDVTRTGTKPLAFGGGIHFCLGALLARMEAQIALGALLARLPDLTLPERSHPNWRANVFLRGLEALPVCYTRRDDRRLDLTKLAKRVSSVGEPTS